MGSQVKQQELRNRYPGVKPFTAEEKELFFGREKDTDDLYSLLFIKQTVVLYGKSGYGKSSLLNAGILPRLEEEGNWTCFTIRFNNFSERETKENVSPMDNIRLRLRQDLPPDATQLLDRVLPGEDSFWYWVKAHQTDVNKNRFIFFFDQFEELFTYPRQRIEEFSEQLSQLLYNTLPVRFRKRVAEMDEQEEVDEALHSYLYDKPEVKVVLSVRSDRLSLLNMLADRHPTILQNCYQLDALSREQAEQAIVRPAAATEARCFVTPPFGFSKAAVDKILDSIGSVQDGKIETATLQIICRYVEQELVQVRGITLITDELLGDITDIFRQYYEGVLARLNERDREKVQHLIEDELIEEGRRNTLTDVYIRNRFGFDGGLLQQLEQSSLLRKERDAAGRILYEISHDTLVNAIELVAKKRRETEEQTKRAKLEETLAAERRRTEHLEELNEKAVYRSRLAIALAVVSLLIALVAVYYWDESRRDRDRANTMKWLAQVQEQKAEIALFENNLEKAKSLVGDAHTYMRSADFDLAMGNLHISDSLLRSSDSLFSSGVPFPKQDVADKNSLMATIRSDKDSCEHSKH